MATRPRPNDRALRGRNDIVSSPGAIDASSGGQALGQALGNIGSVTLRRLTENIGDQLTRDVVLTERERGREAGATGATRLSNGQVVPTVTLRRDNSIRSQAFNEGVLQTAPNRLQAELTRTMAQIEDENRGRPDRYLETATSYYDAFRAQLPAELQADYDPLFARLTMAARRRQEAIFVGRQRDNVRFSNVDAVEELFATGGREAFALASVNPEEREIAGSLVLDQRERLERMLAQNDPLGDAIYSPEERQRILRTFDEQTLISSALGGLDRAPDKEAYVRAWTESARAAGEETPAVIDKVEARLFTELRRINTGRNAMEADLRRETAGMVDVLEAGITPTGYLDHRQRLAEAGFDDQLEALDTAFEFRETMSDFTQSSLAAQRALIEEGNRQETMTADELAVQDMMIRRHADAQSNLLGPSASPYAYAQRVGVVDTIAPIDDFSADALGLRGMQQDRIADTFGVAVPFLRPGEERAILAQFNSGDPETATAVMRSFSTLPDDKLQSVATQLSGESPAVARAFQFAAAPGGQDNANLIVRGYQLGLVPEASDLRPPADAMRVALETVYKDIAADDPSVFASFAAATEAIYLARLRERGETEINSALLEESAHMAAGGVMFGGELIGGAYDFAGKRILSPAPGVTEREFTDLITGLTSDHMVQYSVDGGAPSFADGSAFSPELLQAGIGRLTNISGFFSEGAFALESAGSGRYAIVDKAGKYIQSSTGVYLIDLGAAWADGIGRAP